METDYTEDDYELRMQEFEDEARIEKLIEKENKDENK